MAIIYSYPAIDELQGSDLILVADVSKQNQTKSASISQMTSYTFSNVTGSNGITINRSSNTLDIDGTTLQTNIATNATNITAEETARITADNTLQNNIDSEATTRANADTTLQGNIDTEASTRANADTALQSGIDTNANNISTNATAISTNASGISSNASAISTNSGNISANSAAINTNTGNISTNTTAIAGKVSKTGDTMTGDLTINANLNVGGISDTRFIKATDGSGNDVLKIEKVNDDVNLYLNDNNSSNNDSKIVFQSFRAANNTYIANFNNYDDGDESHILNFNVDGESYFSVGYNDISGTPESQLRAIKCTKPIVANGGVYIGGSNSNNNLDDYEEGTFSPTLVVSGTSTTINDKLGRYTKIGNLVHVEIFIRDFVPEDLTTIIQSCTNLPFTIKDTTFASFAIGQLRNFSNGNTGRGVVYGNDNTTTITFYDNGFYTTLPGDETTEVSVNITYQTS